ncbi:unnamed protein product [Prunus armeniaca]
MELLLAELTSAELPRQNPLLSNSLGGTLFDRLEIQKLWRFLLGGLEVSELVDIGKFDHPKTFYLVKVANGVSLEDTEGLKNS